MPAPVLQFKRGNAGVAGTVPALRPGEPAISLNNFDFFIGIDTSVANNKFFGSHRYWGREDGTNSLKLKLVDKDGTNYVAIKAPNTVGSNVTYTLPGIQGASNTVLTNDGSGNLSWGSGSANPVFSGIATFTDTTDNTLGNADTGAVQIDGGLGVNKNVTVGGNLNVQGYTELVGVVTFRGGTINLGDSNTDDIVVAGEFKSSLVPTDDNTYDLGGSGKRWRNINSSGIATIGSLVCNDGSLFTGSVQIDNNLNVNGNITLGGTSYYNAAYTTLIRDKDIVLGVTTDISLYPDTSTDNTANHGGIAIASTEGSPLISLQAVGINSLPDTYKQFMWVKSGTFAGLGTDAWLSNYAIGIGSTQVPSGVRLAVGGVQITDTAITATTGNFTTLSGSLTGTISTATRANTVDTVTASDTNAIYHLTFVNSHNGSATAENVYTDDGIYYNPGTNTFTTQYGYFTGNVTVDGTITGTATTSTTVTTTGTSDNNTYYVTFADTSAGQVGETLRVGTSLSLNASTGNVKSAGDLIAGSGYLASGNGTRAMYMYDTSGDVSFQGKVVANNFRSSSNASNTLTFSDLDATFARNLVITGITTIGTGVGITQFSASVSTGSSASSVPTSKAVIDYVGNQIGNVDLTLGINADTGGPSTVNTSQTLTIAGTPNEIQTSVSGQTITIGLPDDVIVGTSLSAPTIRTNIIQSQNTGATAITITANDVQIADDLTVGGNLYVNGSTTQVNTTSLTVEDRTIELGVVDGSAPSSATTWDLGVLFNYYDTSAKKSALIWEQGDARFKLGSVISDGGGTGNSNPQITFTSYAALEISDLWINNSCTGGAQQVIGCVGSELQLNNITIDAGTF